MKKDVTGSQGAPLQRLFSFSRKSIDLIVNIMQHAKLDLTVVLSGVIFGKNNSMQA